MTWLLTYSGESFVRKCLSLDFPKSLEKIPSPWGFAFKITRICFWFLKNTTGAGPLGASHQAADSFDRDEAFPRKRTVGDVGTWYVFVQKKDLKDVHPWNLTSNHWFSGDMLVFGGVTDVFSGVYVCIPGTLWWPRLGFLPAVVLGVWSLFWRGKNPSQRPPRLKHAIIVGPWSREKILQVANWLWICRKKHAVAPLQVHDVWSTKSAECSLKSFHRFQLTGPSWKHSNGKCCVYNLQVYTYGCLKSNKPTNQPRFSPHFTDIPKNPTNQLHHLRGNPSAPLPSSSSLGRSNSSAAIQLFPGYRIAWAPFKWRRSQELLHPRSFFSQRLHTPEKPWMVGVGRRK